MSHYIPIKHHKRPWNYHDTPICEATGGCPLTRWHADACIVVHVENFKRLTATGTLHWVTNWTFHKNWALSSNQQPPSRVTTTSSQLRTPINSLCLLVFHPREIPSQLIVLPQPFSADGSQILLCEQPAIGGVRISKDSNLQPIFIFFHVQESHQLHGWVMW